MQSILNEPTIGEMEDALTSLPLTLHDAFDEMIARIQRQPEGRRRLAMHTLTWLTHAMSPLTVTELSEALAIRPGQKSLNRRYCPSQKSILSCCLGLVTVDEESSSVRLAHYSIQEYLRDRGTEIFPSAEDELAEKCLTYLFLDPLSRGCCEFAHEIPARMKDYPFLQYATHYWGHHTRQCRSGKPLKLAVQLLNSQPRRAMSTQIYNFSRGLRNKYWVPDEVNSLTGLHLASSFGLEDAARDILASGNVEIDAETRMGTTALIGAAAAGHVQTVRLLLREKADTSKTNWYGTALHCAAEAGQCESIRVLLDAGMAVDCRDPFQRTSLHCAVGMGRTSAVALLLRRGADPTAPDEDGRTPVHHAVEGDFARQTLPFLVEHGVDINKKILGSTMLHNAAKEGYTNKVDVLLANGADVECRDNDGYTPLHCATSRNRKWTVRKLLRKGANVNSKNNDGITPIAMAAVMGFTAVEDMLLEYVTSAQLVHRS